MVFSRVWFHQHQKPLLWLANSWLGRRLLRIDTREKIIRIEPNAVWWKKGGKFVAEFRTHDKYAKRLYYALYPVWRLAHAWDSFWSPRFNLGFDTLTQYPDPDPETATVDGRCFRTGIDESWATIHDAADGTGAQDSGATTQHVYIKATTTTDQWGDLYRSFYLFDTASLTAGATITAATLSIYVTVADNDFTGAMGIVTTTPASNTALAAGDYDQLGTTRQASDINIASLTTSAYNDFALNATGLGNVSKTGISKFGSRMSQDIDNSPPTWSSGVDGGVTASYADETGTSQDPKLVVTYTVARASYGFFM